MPEAPGRCTEDARSGQPEGCRHQDGQVRTVTQQSAGGHGQPLWYGGGAGTSRTSQGQVQRGGQRKARLHACLRRTPQRDLLLHRRTECGSRREDAQAQPEAHAEESVYP